MNVKSLINLRVGNSLKMFRQSHELSVSDLSSRSGLSVEELLALESGSLSMNLVTLLTLCVVLNVVPNDILDGLFC